MAGDSLLLATLVTVTPAIFIAELTDKDALLILSLATHFKPWLVFAAGSIAFVITSAVIVSVGQLLVTFVPVSWVTLVGGTIMIGYGLWSYFRGNKDEHEIMEAEHKLSAGASSGVKSAFLTAVGLLILLDLAGDATEVLTILFVARFHDAVTVFAAAVIALVAATAVETTIGNRLSRILSVNRIRIFSLLVFLIIGSTAVVSVLLHF
jgi:putative Ca2+/H+ antiporter (TMEM165/GDT1 family)